MVLDISLGASQDHTAEAQQLLQMELILGPVLDTHEKGINYICKDTGIFTGKPTLLTWRKKISKW